MTIRRLLRPVLGLLFSLLIFLASGEAVLRVIYRDQGRATLGGPGGHSFQHRYIKNEERGRFDTGPRRPGAKRLLVVGDSISWGLGVRDWSAIWTERLAQALERKGGPIEMAVLAEPGRLVLRDVPVPRPSPSEIRTPSRQIARRRDQRPVRGPS